MFSHSRMSDKQYPMQAGRFAAAISKLEGIEIDFAFWMFFEALNCRGRCAFTWGLYECMQN